jgi:sugar O-acyltransferase (sialic acid O-acetyltransferase NeuD family)
MSTLYLCGAGNSEGVRLALRIQEALSPWTQIVLLDDDPAMWGRDRIGVPIVAGFDRLADADPARDRVVNLVARTTGGRARARQRIASYGVPFCTLIHPSVDCMGVAFADDVIVYPNVTLGPETRLGQGCVVFMGAVIGHESVMGDGCVVAANAVLNARVELGEQTYVGTNATILPEVRVGARCTLGAGSVLVNDLADDHTAVGVPAVAASMVAVTAPREPPADWTATVSEVWRRVLGREQVPSQRSFFDLGGTSLKAAQLAATLQGETGVSVSVVDVFRFPTVASLADHLASGSGGSGGGAGSAAGRARADALRRRAVSRA